MLKGKMRALLAGLVVLAVIAAACSDDGSTTPSEAATPTPTCLTTGDLYALFGPESDGFGNWSDANTLASEVGGTGGFPDLTLEITAPGEESGTYDAFIDLAGIEDTAIEQGLSEDDAAALRSDYQSSGNDNIIIQAMEGGNPGALGFVGFAFATEAADQVKVIEVDGGEGCVTPTADTIADGSYPLSRSLYIYVNKEKITSNPPVKPYVDFNLSDTGFVGTESAVGLAEYVPLPQDRIDATRSAWETEAGAAGAGGTISGSITISGSSTVQPISSTVAEFFNEEQPDVAITVDGPGTGDGFVLFCEGEIDIADASRPIEEEEIKACKDAGIEYVELEVAFDGITVMTSPAA